MYASNIHTCLSEISHKCFQESTNKHVCMFENPLPVIKNEPYTLKQIIMKNQKMVVFKRVCLSVYVWKPSACHGKRNIYAQTYTLNHHTKVEKSWKCEPCQENASWGSRRRSQTSRHSQLVPDASKRSQMLPKQMFVGWDLGPENGIPMKESALGTVSMPCKKVQHAFKMWPLSYFRYVRLKNLWVLAT